MIGRAHLTKFSIFLSGQFYMILQALDASLQYLYRLQYKSLGHIRFLYNHACFVPHRVKERHPGNCSREQGKKI